MLDRRFTAVLIFFFFLLSLQICKAAIVSRHTIRELQHSQSVKDEILLYQKIIDRDQIEALTQAFLYFPRNIKQEVILEKLLQQIEISSVPISDKLAIFLKSIRQRPAKYYIQTIENRVEITRVAFDSMLSATRLYRRWFHKQLNRAFLSQVHQRSFVFKKWLHASAKAHREQVMLKNLPWLSDQELTHILTQLKNTQDPEEKEWLLKIARVSQNPLAYHALWQSGNSHSITMELKRLARKNDDFSIQQLMTAIDYPKLTQTALNFLCSEQFDRAQVRVFLRSQLNTTDRTRVTATSLIQNEQISWLKENMQSLNSAQRAQVNLAFAAFRKTRHHQ